MKTNVLLLLYALLGIHRSMGADEDGGTVPEKIDEGGAGPDKVDNVDVMQIGDAEFMIAAGVLEGIMHTEEHTEHQFSKIGPILANMYKASRNDKDQQASPGVSAYMETLGEAVEAIVQEEKVLIDAVVKNSGTVQDMISELSSLGFELEGTYKHMASGRIPIASLGQVSKSDTLLFAIPALQFTKAGEVTSSGVFAMEANKVSDLGRIGTGVTVGVLSDSYDSWWGAQYDIASGDLPPEDKIFVLEDYWGDDEGRALMQIIHDVAPGANLAFHTAAGGQAAFAGGIFRLASEVGAKVIVDDIGYYNEPAFQDGIIAHAIDEVTDKYNVAYFSAAGNWGRQSYEHAFVDSGESFMLGPYVFQGFHDFAGGSTPLPKPFQTVYLPNSRSVTLTLQWDEPFASAFPNTGAKNDLDIILFDSTASVVLAAAAAGNYGRDPIEILEVDVNYILEAAGRGNDPGFNFQIAIALWEGEPPGLMKLTISPDPARFIDHPTNSGTSYGHEVASGSAAVGAAFDHSTPYYGVDPPLVESYSAAGGTPKLFDFEGKRLAKPEIREQPKFVGPDGAINTFFPTPDHPYFFGTSAAAPHVAAVAALMLEANPELEPSKIVEILQNTAMDMSDPETHGADVGFDFRTGYGFVNASAAVDAV